MNIELKPNNRPTKPGYYLCHNASFGFPKPAVAEVRLESNGKLTFLSSGSIYPLADCDPDMIWSDAFTFTVDNSYKDYYGERPCWATAVQSQPAHTTKL